MCFLSVQSTQNSGATTAGSTSASSGSAGEGSSTAGGSTSGVGQSPASAAAGASVGNAASAGGHLVLKAGANFVTILLLLIITSYCCDLLYTLYCFIGIYFYSFSNHVD